MVEILCGGWIVATSILSLVIILEFVIIYLLIKYNSTKKEEPKERKGD